MGDCISLILTFIIVTQTMLETKVIEIKVLRILAAIASCLLLAKLYDWLRLFETTSFYC